MVQTKLLQDTTTEDRWRPIVPLYRPRSIARIRPRQSLPGQLFLPGMEPLERSCEVVDEALPETPQVDANQNTCNAQLPARPTCPNCGGQQFDEGGDCRSCRAPAVVRPS